MSDTPRTDDQIGYDGSTMTLIRIEFAKQLERELNAANERIKRLEEAGDEMYKFINPPSPSMRTIRMDNLLQGWDDAKIGKEAKP